MTSGVSRLLTVGGLALLFLCAPASGAEAPAWDLQRLMQELRQVKSDKAKFVERRDIAILSEPLESSGTLVYVAPERLEKHTLLPRQESLVVERDRLKLESKARNQRRTFGPRDHPAIWAFVESMRSTLAGDLATLSRFYKASFEGSERQWQLTLKPIDPDVRAVVSEICIGGSGRRVDAVSILESNGDRSLLTITRDVQ